MALGNREEVAAAIPLGGPDITIVAGDIQISEHKKMVCWEAAQSIDEGIKPVKLCLVPRGSGLRAIRCIDGNDRDAGCCGKQRPAVAKKISSTNEWLDGCQSHVLVPFDEVLLFAAELSRERTRWAANFLQSDRVRSP